MNDFQVFAVAMAGGLLGSLVGTFTAMYAYFQPKARQMFLEWRADRIVRRESNVGISKDRWLSGELPARPRSRKARMRGKRRSRLE